mmetsp:Transcript_102110/g.284300  ORF Transcript_102110/g.284300 Transcript_102110/m.284300 type:complete len:584 (+) Transcript_102110:44-1795(+)
MRRSAGAAMAAKGEPSKNSKKRTRAKTELVARTELQRRLGAVLASQYTMGAMSLVIFFNLILVVVETDILADNNAKIPPWLDIVNNLLLLLYTVELAARLFVERCHFFCDIMNVVDFLVVSADIFILLLGQIVGDLPSVSIFRIVRLVRLSRAYKVMMLFPELSMMLRGLVGAFKAIVWGSVMVGFILTCWGILAVQLVHPLNVELTKQGIWDDAGCDRCPRAFESVSQSMLTFTQQIVAGDSWGQVSVPIIEHYPATAIFFTTTLVSVNLAILNLILAVIVDKANEGQRESESEVAWKKEREKATAKERFVQMCQRIDKDKSGQLSFEELDAGWENNADFQELMFTLDIDREDMHVVFKILDGDGSGMVDYSEFARQLQKLKALDMHTLLVFIKFYVVDIFEKVREQLKWTKAANHRPSQSSEQTDVEEWGPELKAHGPLAPEHPADRARPPSPSPASSWSEKLERSAPTLGVKEAKLARHSQEAAQLRDDLAQALARLADQVERHTRLLERALPLPPAAPDGRAASGGTGLGAAGAGAAALLEELPTSPQVGSRGRRVPKGQVPTTMICCRAQHEEVQRLS